MDPERQVRVDHWCPVTVTCRLSLTYLELHILMCVLLSYYINVVFLDLYVNQIK